MPAAAACSLQRLDDNLAQHVISCACLDSCKALSLTCRRFCHLVRSSRSFKLGFGDDVATPQTLAKMPAIRAYKSVHHLCFSAYTDDDAECLPSWCRLCGIIGPVLQRWPAIEHITIDQGWFYADDAEEVEELELAGYLMRAVPPLRQAKALRRLTIDRLADSYSLVYLRLLTQLTELSMSSWGEEDVGLVVGNPPKAPLADMIHLRALNLDPDGSEFKLCEDSSVNQATLPLVLPPNLTRLEVAVPSCRPGMFWRHMAACSQLVSIRVWEYYVDAAADHPSWMLCRLADSLRNLRHFTIDGFGKTDTSFLPAVLGKLARTAAGQQQQEEQGWDWAGLAAPGLGATAAYNTVVVPPPNMSGLVALQTVTFTYGYELRCCGPHHWRALAGCKQLQQLSGLEAWAVPPAGVKFPGVTDLRILVSTPPGDAVTVLGAFPALQKLQLKLDLGLALAQEDGQQIPQPHQQQQQQQQEAPTLTPAADEQEGLLAQQQEQQAPQRCVQEAAVLLCSLTRLEVGLTCKATPLPSEGSTLWRSLWRAMPALQHLQLGWPYEVDLLQQLPPLGAITGLTSLALSSCTWHHKRMCRQRVRLQELLRVLQGCNKLQWLSLQLAVSRPDATAPSIGVLSANERGSGGSSSSKRSGGESRQGRDVGGTSSAGGNERSKGTHTNSSSSRDKDSGSDSDVKHSGSGDKNCDSSDQESANQVSRDQLVLSMQELLPSLKCLLQGKQGRVAPLAADTLAALRPGLVVGHAW